jgi:hypothetical protein
MQREFGLVVRNLLLARGYTTKVGNANWAAFAGELDGVHYETLHKAVTGERVPSEWLMERVAEALAVDPHGFYEYELAQVRKQFDPKLVGWKTVLRNLLVWERASASAPRPS